MPFSYRARQFEKHGFEKNAFKVFSSKNSMFSWRDKKIHDFHNFSNSGLKFYMRISECMWNRIMMKKNIDFLAHLQEKLPLKVLIFLGGSRGARCRMRQSIRLQDRQGRTFRGFGIRRNGKNGSDRREYNGDNDSSRLSDRGRSAGASFSKIWRTGGHNNNADANDRSKREAEEAERYNLGDIDTEKSQVDANIATAAGNGREGW